MQQMRLQVIAENIAHAQTTRTADGGPYKRQEVVFSAVLKGAANLSGDRALPRMEIQGIREDSSEGPRVHQPGHPDADEEGFVSYPNVAVSLEMVDLMQASRAYEANLQVVRASKSMAEQAMLIGR